MSNIEEALRVYTAGDLTTAQELLKKELEINPSSVDANHLMGVIYFTLNNISSSLMHLEKAHFRSPNNHDILCNYASVLRSSGDNKAAYRLYVKAHRLQPNFFKAINGLGLVAEDSGRFAKAKECYKKCVKLRPENPGVHFNLGNIYTKTNENLLAEEAFLKAIAIKPSVQALNNLGNVLIKQHKEEQALQYLKQAIEIESQNPICYLNITNCYLSLFNYEKAMEMAQQGLTFDVNNIKLMLAISHIYNLLGDHKMVYNWLNKALDCKSNSKNIGSEILYLSHNYDDEKYKQLSLVGREIFKENCDDFNYKPNKKKSKRKKIKIGFFSGDFKIHSVAYFILGLLNHLNKEKFEIICFSNTQDIDEVTDIIKKNANVWIDSIHLSDLELVEVSRDLKLDFAFDLAGHTKGNRQAVFAKRIAPIQINYLGFPGTSANTAMDYRFVDDITDINSDDVYTEKLIKLNSPFISYTPAENPPNIEPLTGKVVLGCFNNSTKMGDDSLDLFANALNTVPDSTLLLKSKAFKSQWLVKQFLNRMQNKGIDISRVKCVGWQDGIYNGLDYYNKIDIAIDTYPYNGTTTTCEALYMGTPVISVQGNTHASRVGSSLLTAMQMSDCICSDKDDFIVKLKAKVADLDYIRNSGIDLRNRFKQSSICDTKTFTSKFEKQLELLINL